MAKRPYQDSAFDDRPPAKRPFSSQAYSPYQSPPTAYSRPVDHEKAYLQLPPSQYPTLTPLPPPSAHHPTYTHGLPDLPPLAAHLTHAPFRHKSTLAAYDRTDGAADLSYERLEFLGDAYLELFASRLIFARYAHLPAGRMSQLRELLVKNETLAEYAARYGFAGRVEVLDPAQAGGMVAGGKKNKGFNKILGDVFEAYVAAVVLGEEDAAVGAAKAEAWLGALWSVKLLEQQERDDTLRPPRGRNGGAAAMVPGAVPSAASTAGVTVPSDGGTQQPPVDLSKMYSATGKQDLQKRIGGPKVTLLYEPFRASEELKGDQLGQSRHFIALYLTGYGHNRLLLGKGEGKSKAEAGHRAAMEAMHGKHKTLIDTCEVTLQKEKAEKKALATRPEHATPKEPADTTA